MTPLVGPAIEQTAPSQGLDVKTCGCREFAARTECRENYGDPEISCAASGEFAHAIGPRAPIEMKLAQ